MAKSVVLMFMLILLGLVLAGQAGHLITSLTLGV